MRKTLLVCLLGLVLISGVGCANAATGRAFNAVSPEANQAVIYVYRPNPTYVGSAVVLNITVDNEKIGGLKNGGYLFKVVPPGKHAVACKTETTAEVPVEAAAGKSYYIEAAVEMGLFVGRPKLTMVPEETGKLAILSTKLSE
jgi:hypothetical protein